MPRPNGRHSHVLRTFQFVQSGNEIPTEIFNVRLRRWILYKEKSIVKLRAQKLILKSFLSPGDIVTLTACVRDLHVAYPGEYQTGVHTACPELWLNNPHVTSLEEGAEVIEMFYDRPVAIRYQEGHFINGYRRFLEYRLGRHIPQGPLHGDIYLSDEEREQPSQVAVGWHHHEPFWLIVAGGKNDFTCKLWEHARYQRVVDHFLGRIQFVQIGERGHNHRPLCNVINLLGRTNLRQLILLTHHASGVLCPVTAAMHLAEAVPTRNGRRRACVVIAGAREPVAWEKYEGHDFLHNCGELCCATRLDVPGACWRSRVVRRGDGSEQDSPERICEQPVCTMSGQIIPECLNRITAEMVIERIEKILACAP